MTNRSSRFPATAARSIGSTRRLLCTVKLQIPIHRADCVVLGGEKHYRYSRYRDTMEVTLPRIPPERVDVVLGMDVLEAFHVTIHEDQYTMVY